MENPNISYKDFYNFTFDDMVDDLKPIYDSQTLILVRKFTIF